MTNKNKPMANKEKTEPQDDQLYMYDWVFHFNPYSEEWSAIPKKLYYEYWNNKKHPDILRSKKVTTLLEILYKAKGDVDEIQKLVSGK